MNENEIRNDKLKDLIPLTVSFFPGESPTAEKLEGMMSQVEVGIQFLEETIGDFHNRTVYSTSWGNNISRFLGDLSFLNPIILPSYTEDNYVQNLTLGKTDHELDFIPFGNGTDMIALSNDSSVVISQYKNSEDDLIQPGDWTIKSTYSERNLQKNEKRLITHSPSDGGNIIFTKVGTGRAAGNEGVTYSVIPSPAQMEMNGEAIQVTLSPGTHLFTLTLPTIQFDKDIDDSNHTTNLSNTNVHIVSGRRYLLPEYFFDPDGLNLEADSTGIRPERVIPKNLIQIYDWETKQRVEGIIEYRTSPVIANRRFEFTVLTETGTEIDPTRKYVIAVRGTSLSEQIKNLTHFMIHHNHANWDMERRLKHSDLLDLRTSTDNPTDRSEYYGPSNINNNDHSMYLHRKGFTDSDIGAGANIMRGHLVIGNTDLGDPTEHEHYNLNEDSFSLMFGKISDGGLVTYIKNFIHSIVFGRNNIPKDFMGESLVITGAKTTSTNELNTYIDGSLRVSRDVTLGSTNLDSVIISGNLFIKESLTLLPMLSGNVTLERGTVFFDDQQNELSYYDGSKLIAPGRTGITVLVGDGINSKGKYNGTTYQTITDALTEAATKKGTVKILRGLYSLESNTLTIPSYVRLVGEGPQTVIEGRGTLIQMNGIESEVSGLKLKGDSISNFQIGVDFIGATKCKVEDTIFEDGVLGIHLDVTSTENILGDGLIYNNVTTIDRADEFCSETNYRLSKNLVGIRNKIHMFDYGSKENFANKWRFIGSINTQFLNNSTNSTLGRGTIKINGSGGKIVFDEIIAVAPNGGLGMYIDIRKMGASGKVDIGIECYDRNHNYLGVRKFVANNQEQNTTMTYRYGALTEEGTNTSTDFIVGTRYAKPYIYVYTNSNGIEFDNFVIEPLTIARYSTFA